MDPESCPLTLQSSFRSVSAGDGRTYGVTEMYLPESNDPCSFVPNLKGRREW